VKAREVAKEGAKRRKASSALRVAAIEASHAAVHHDDRRRAALGTELRTLRKMGLSERIGLLRAGLKLRTFFIDELFLMLIKFRTTQ